MNLGRKDTNLGGGTAAYVTIIIKSTLFIDNA